MIENLRLADLYDPGRLLVMPPDAPVSEVLGLMGERAASAVVLAQDGRPVGIFTERDALGLVVRGACDPAAAVSAFMTPDPLTALPDLPFVDGYVLMAGRGVRHLVVVDADGRLCGLVSEGHFVAALGAEELLVPRTVGALMTPDPVTLTAGATVAGALALMADRHISSVLIAAAGRALGILTERDAVRLAGADLDLAATPVAAQMSSPVLTIDQHRPAYEAMALMRSQGVRRLAVVDESGLLVGILTRKDLLKDIQEVYLNLLRRVLAVQGQALQDARQQLSRQSVLRSLLEHSADLGVIAADAALGIHFINAAAAQALGLTSASGRDLPLSGLLESAGLAAGEITGSLAALTGAERLTLDLSREAGGERRWLRLVGSAIRNAGGAREGYLLTVQDRTQAQADAEQLRAIFDTSAVGIGLRDLGGRVVLANPALLAMLGYEDHPRGLLGRHFSEITAAEDRERELAEAARLLAGEVQSYRLEKRYRRRNGYILLADVSVSVIRDAAGRVTNLLVMVSDISDLRRAQENLLEAQTIAHLGNWDVDPEVHRLTWSPELYRIFGLPPATPVNPDDFFSGIHPDDRQRVLAAYYHSLGKAEPLDIRHRVLRPDGSERWVRTRGVHAKDEAGRVIRSLGTVQDITEEYAAEQQQRLVQALFENTSEGILITDADNRIVTVNPAFSAITGYSQAEVLGQNPRLLSSGRHPPAFFRAFWERLNRTGAWSGEVWNRRKNGEVYPEWLQVNLVRGADGRVVQHLATFTDLSAARRSAEELEYLRHHDPLTGLPNLGRLGELLGVTLERASGGRERLALLVLDLDRFQDVVAAHGYAAADEALRVVGGRLAAAIRPPDILARLVGDAFAVARILDPELEVAVQANLAAESLQQTISRPLAEAGLAALTVTASVGIALYPEDGAALPSLLRNAESALKQAKQAARGSVAFYRPEMTRTARRRIQLEGELRRALADGELRLLYQPIVAAASGVLVGAEALIRWQHPADGLLAPRDFIAAVEQSDLVHPVGRWVFAQAAAQARDWCAHGRLRVSVNVTGHQIAMGRLAQDLEAVLAETGLDPQLLGIEVLESVLLRDPDQALAELNRVRDLGIAVALDDFGSGYSSLNYFKRLPVDTLKIDRGFIRHLTTDPTDEAIVRSTISMAHNLGKQVVAEGVETTEQFGYLARAGCDLVQGYLLGRPMPAAALGEALCAGRDWRPASSGAGRRP